MTHALVVGGTGMLREATLWLATRFDVVSVIARSKDRLQLLASDAALEKGTINPLPLDYRDEECIRRHLREAIGQFGQITLVLSWIHSTAPKAHRVMAEILDGQTVECRWFDVLGSAAADPSGSALDSHREFLKWKRLRYRSVVLGFLVEGEGSRWLTNREIGRGTIEAIREDAASSVVGRVRPWSGRP